MKNLSNAARFSVITPVHLWNEQRVERFLETIESLKEQSFKDFQWVVIDDGSTMGFRWDMLNEAAVEAGFQLTLTHRPHEERVVAYNDAFQLARGEWFVLLDSDDELVPNALEKLDRFIKKYPNEKMFNFGCLYHHADGGIVHRDPFTPKRKKTGHEQFGGGNIVNGTFIFKREIYLKFGGYPNTTIKGVDTSEINYGGVRDLYMGSPWDFSAAAQLEFPEIREYFMVDHENEPNKVLKELGNPWGQDYYLFYKYTRHFHSRVLKEYLYIVHPR
jgi:glycosyltransferase involved in cell wall biosynthesis